MAAPQMYDTPLNGMGIPPRRRADLDYPTPSSGANGLRGRRRRLLLGPRRAMAAPHPAHATGRCQYIHKDL
ncbi:MAG: hypothetical protein ACRDQZ_16375 [Mycobacteriales bacterium]